MKVLMIAPTPYFSDRGCHVRIYEEAASLKNLGHNLLICTYHLGRNIGDIPVWRIPNIPWYKKTAAGASWHKFYLDFLLLLLSVKAIITFKPDVIHAHLHEGAFIALILQKVFKKPVVFDYQGSLSSESVDHQFVSPQNPLLKLAKWVESKVDKGADYLITSAPRDLKIANSQVIMDGADLKVFKPDLALRRPQTLIYLGLLGVYQGIDLMLEAFSNVVKEFPEAKLLIGGFPKIDFYKVKTKELGISDNVEFLGAVPYAKAAEFLNHGQIAIAPKISISEANQKILNYMACGIPTVAFDTKINEEMLGDARLLATCSSCDSLSEKLKMLLSLSDEARQEIGRKLRNRVEDKFSWDKAAVKITAVYEAAGKIFSSKQTKSSSGLVKQLPKLLISGLLLFLVLRQFDFVQAFKVTKSANFVILSSVLVLIVLKNFLSSLRWKILLEALGPKVPFLALLRLYFIGIFFNNFLPSSIGGDIVKAYKLSKHTGQAFDSSLSVFMERLAGVSALALIGLVSSIFVFGIWGILALIVMAVGITVSLKLTDRFSSLHPALTKLWKTVRVYDKHPRVLVAAFGFSLIIQLISIFSQFLVFRSIGVNLPILKSLVAFPMINLFTFLTLLPNGWGAQELLYSYLFGTIGIAVTLSVTVSLIYRLLTLVTALVGGLFYAFER